MNMNKASGLTAKKINLYSDIDAAIDDAGSDFVAAGHKAMQAWVKLFNAFESSGLSKNAFATRCNGKQFGDYVLQYNTVNRYLGLIEWALAYLSEDMEDDATTLDLLNEFEFVSQIQDLKNKSGKVAERQSAKRDPIAAQAARIKKMSKAEQNRLRKALGW